jgi:hypothetical protein
MRIADRLQCQLQYLGQASIPLRSVRRQLICLAQVVGARGLAQASLLS